MTTPSAPHRRLLRSLPPAIAVALSCLLVGTQAAPPALAADDDYAAARPSAGAPGIGDRLYPKLGNGGFEVAHYDLNLRYATAKRSQGIDGTATIRAIATQALSRFDLDFAGKSVGAVRVNGRPATFTRQGPELVITPAKPLRRGQKFTITVEHFRSDPTVADPTSRATRPFMQTAEGSVWVSQPDGAHMIFPCSDHPSDPASFSFRIDVPAGTTAVANGTLTSRRTSGGRTVWRYRMRAPMATELAQVAVGKFTVTNRGRAGRVTLRDVTPTASTAKLLPKLATQRGHLAWMQKQVGRYPFGTYGALVSDAQFSKALETQTLTMYPAAVFELDKRFYDTKMVHELAHQWFGNSVMPARWSDVWLNEGHATWYEHVYGAETKNLISDQGKSVTLDAYMKDIYRWGNVWRSRFGPVAAPLGGNAEDLFSINVYDGGALTLYALRQKIGAQKFQVLQRTWVSKNRGRAVSTADFIALASRVSGQDLSGFLTDWVYGKTVPPMPGHPDWKAKPAPKAAAMASRRD